ncbi:MAG: hypothetical protein K2Y37_14820 [Pirellulales bacterium]|nr:hypothetical protein [Pirellulales bacterium]
MSARDLAALIKLGLPSEAHGRGRVFDPLAVRQWLESQGLVHEAPGQSKFTPDRRARILAAARAGQWRSTAATAGGIDYATLKRWLNRAASEPAYAEFRRELLEAERAAELDALAGIRSAGRDDWRALAWYLERRHAKRWAKREHLTTRLHLAGQTPGDQETLLAEIEAQLTAAESDPDT